MGIISASEGNENSPSASTPLSTANIVFKSKLSYDFYVEFPRIPERSGGLSDICPGNTEFRKNNDENFRAFRASVAS